MVKAQGQGPAKREKQGPEWAGQAVLPRSGAWGLACGGTNQMGLWEQWLC